MFLTGLAALTGAIVIGLVIASRLLAAGKPDYEPQKLTPRDLDLVAASYGLKRKKKWWVFKEADSSLRKRVLEEQRGRFSVDRVRRRAS